jgi:CxxC-x17-CxxC domain-containing protein
MNQDKTITCKDCGQEFTFSASEQEFYAEKGFNNEPVRCKSCRTARKQRNNRQNGRTQRKMYDAICSNCGVKTQVPFRPSGDRPVYCKDCFKK